MDNKPLEMRRLCAGDGGLLGRFFEALSADAETARYFHPHPLTPAYAERLCAGLHLVKDQYFGVWYRGHLAAYAMLRGWDEGFAVPSFGGSVHPAARGAGLGQYVLAGAIEVARAAGARRMRLTVYRANERARHVYHKAGFTFQERGSDALLGTLELDTAGSAAPAVRLEVLDRWAAQQQPDLGDTGARIA